MIKRRNRVYSQLEKLIRQLKTIIGEAISNPKQSNVSWEAYFWGDREVERYSLPIK